MKKHFITELGIECAYRLYGEGPDVILIHGLCDSGLAWDNHAQLLAGSVLTPLRWLGALPRDASFALPERHLGLAAASEVGDIDRRLDALADAWSLHASAELPPPVAFPPAPRANVTRRLEGVRIAVARGSNATIAAMP